MTATLQTFFVLWCLHCVSHFISSQHHPWVDWFLLCFSCADMCEVGPMGSVGIELSSCCLPEAVDFVRRVRGICMRVIWRSDS
mmetsp:Transcript_59062/g.129371  ORF Transcript_59062/g.129371 Transcript_59062/m.129371 type:complete len:83 (+) Transcript_59062:1427-1675(+)